MELDNYDEAINDYQRVLGEDDGNQQVCDDESIRLLRATLREEWLATSIYG